MKINKLFMGAILVCFMNPNASANLFTVTCNGSTANCTLLETLRAQLQTSVNAELPDAIPSEYLKGMANASVMSSKGNGIDYSSDIDVFVVGANIGVGADVGSNSLGDLIDGKVDEDEIAGFGLQPSLMLGINLGMFDLPVWRFFDLNKLKVFVNFFTYSYDKDEINAKITNFGLHFRYKLFEPISILPARMVRWTGVDLSTGFEYSKFNATFTTTKSFSETITTPTTATATANGTIQVGADVTTMSIPIEATTGVQLAYFLNLYTGLGVDLNFGSAKANANANAPITVTGSPVTFTGTLDLGQDDGPSFASARGFVGTQFNISLLKIYTQLDKSFTEDAYTISTGVRVTW